MKGHQGNSNSTRTNDEEFDKYHLQPKAEKSEDASKGMSGMDVNAREQQ